MRHTHPFLFFNSTISSKLISRHELPYIAEFEMETPFSMSTVRRQLDPTFAVTCADVRRANQRPQHLSASAGCETLVVYV